MTAGSVTSDDFPTVGEVAGHPVVLHYGDAAREYAAMHESAVLVDRSARGRILVHGAKAPELITGLLTNDVLALAHGHGLYAAALTAKGKIVADVRVFARETAGERELLIDAPARARDGWLAMVKKFVNPRLAPYEDASSTLRNLALVGPAARRTVGVASSVAPDTLATLPPYGHLSAVIGDVLVWIARTPELEVEGYDLWMPADGYTAVWQELVSSGATPGGLSAWEIARIEAGRPEWGLDIDDGTIPQEANFDELHAISYTKGCYVGQEVVARVHFRGHVNRHLRGLRLGDGDAPPRGTELVDAGGKIVGDVRSSAHSPRLGTVALGMVRRDVEPGTTLRARWLDRELPAGVAPLPFPPS